ncbi:MAG: hypothetical protein JEY96_18155 [Bacteroidales bacterium]|nr:hypothetical protein [Bacteroidales bacterium]
MYSFGIDIGYSAVKVVLIDQENRIVYKKYKPHTGSIKNILELILIEINEDFDASDIIYGSVTGSLGKYLRSNIVANRINEVAAAIDGTKYLNPLVKSIIEIGSHSAKYYTGIQSEENALKISSNSDCAAGTGAFLEEQASRLNIKIEDFSLYAQNAKTIPRIAGRCSVFAKTDIIHNQQEGVPSADILKGIAYALVKNYKGAVMRQLPIETPVLLIGGVGNNKAIVDAFRDVLNKSKLELIVPNHFNVAGAIGAAIIAKEKKLKLNFRIILKDFQLVDIVEKDDDDDLPPLNKLEVEDISAKHKIKISTKEHSNQVYYLGVDIGSTSTNMVLMTLQKEIVHLKYIRTNGNLNKALQEGFKKISGFNNGDITILGVGITGSGRHLIGNNIGADVIKDEITAQAKAAVTIDPEVDTIFEIGGQDSKYISLNNGTVTDFQMNKVCAAGTGSFLDEQAQKFNIPIDKMGRLAFEGEHPVALGERCTVFIESSIASSLSKGKKIENIISGLCYSIAKNYLHRVVGQKKIGKKVFLQGGIAYNQGVANALKIITQKDIKVPPFFSVTGAYGAAILALEEMEYGKSSFIGFEQLSALTLTDKKNIKKPTQTNVNQFQNQIEELAFDNYEGISNTQNKTVGIPRSLFAFGMFPLYNSFFKLLGFNVLLSDWSNEKTIKNAQKHSLDDFCFPMKLVAGHVDELVEKGVDYIFFPNFHNMNRPNVKTRNVYGCTYMQQAGRIMETSLNLRNKDVELLSPTYALNQGKDSMKKLFLELGKQLGKTNKEVEQVLPQCMKSMQQFEHKIADKIKALADKIKNAKISFVIISKMYGVSDPVLNLGIHDKLNEMGYPVIPFYELPMIDISDDHPNMFWAFGQPILSAAHYVSQQPNLYAIYLTHHGCGPDSALIHFFQEIMGKKPYLNIETDEHASTVGVETRIEAFVNSLKHKKLCALQNTTNKAANKTLKIEECLKSLNNATKVYIPNIYPYSSLLKEVLVKQGIQIELLAKDDTKTINLGKKYTLTNEYYSMASLLGDCFKQIENRNGIKDMAFLIPQTEGAEVGALYNRLLRTKLDEENHADIKVLAPYLEDILKTNKTDAEMLFRCLIAGDMIRIVPRNQMDKYLDMIKILIGHDNFDIGNLSNIASSIRANFTTDNNQKRILAIGEPAIVYNDFLNDFTFKNLENQKIKIVYSSFAEAIWMFLDDFSKQESMKQNYKANDLLLSFKTELQIIADELKNASPFASDIDDLVIKADNTLGLHAGAFARYRQAKTLMPPSNIDGIITANSSYENTGVSLNTLHKSFSNGHTLPIINLSFDGNANENNKNKVESFTYYL